MSTATLDEARRLFRENLLDETLALCAEMLERGLDVAEALHIRAAVLLKKGETAEALRVLESSLAQQLTGAKLSTLAAIHFARGDGVAARNALERGVDLRGDSPQSWPNIAQSLLQEGRVDEAAVLLSRTVAACPSWSPGWFMHGTVEAARGSMKSAAEAYDRAYELQPGLVDACERAAACWQAAGRRDLARERWLHVLGDDSGREAARGGLLESLPRAYETAEAEVRDEVERCLGARRYDMQRACDALPALLRAARSWHVMLRRAHDPSLGLNAVEAEMVASTTILRRLLRVGVVTDLGLERLLTVWRRRFLIDGVYRGNPSEESLDLAAAIATHGWHADYAWLESEEETDALSIASSSEAPHAPLALAMYRFPQAPVPRTLQHLTAAVAREREIAERLDVLHEPKEGVSRSVAAQYEAHPYPRWVTMDRTRAQVDVEERVRSEFPWLGKEFSGPVRREGEPLRVLVAGCGTGRVALSVELRLQDAEVLGIDLSRTALAYARRKAEEMAIENVRFAVADVSQLTPADVEHPFHLIEAVGVLHQLEHPLDGLRRLLSLLAPRGLMKIGLYSRTARRELDKARAMAAGTDPYAGASLRGIRRRLLSELPSDSRIALLNLAEFYTTSGLRDLLLPASEREFDLPEIAGMLEALGLRFLGFDGIAPATLAAFVDTFGATSASSLRSWAALEERDPHLFGRMYQFWCQP